MTQSLTERMAELERRLAEEETKSKKKPKYALKIKAGDKRKAQKKDGFVAVLLLGRDKKAGFKVGEISDKETVLVDGVRYAYDPTGVYYTKKFPLIVVYAWRIVNAGGEIEEQRYQGATIATDKDKSQDLLEGLNNAAQQTIIRMIEAGILEDEEKKKKGMSMIWLIIGGIVVLYLIGRALGWA